MRKLVLKANHDVEIVGILEVLNAVAGIIAAGSGPDLEFEYSGGSDVDWDSQEPVFNQGQRQFVTEDGEIVGEASVEVIDV